jgi:hypothetical protein
MRSVQLSVAFRSIVASQQLWLSLVRDTNDTSEVIEGTRIVSASLQEHGPIRRL